MLSGKKGRLKRPFLSVIQNFSWAVGLFLGSAIKFADSNGALSESETIPVMVLL